MCENTKCPAKLRTRNLWTKIPGVGNFRRILKTAVTFEISTFEFVNIKKDSPKTRKN